MNKKDLNYGNVVVTRNGNTYVYNAYLSDGSKWVNMLVPLDDLGNILIDNYKDNLTYNSYDDAYDIMKVYKNFSLKELLWERKPELTDIEKMILKNLDESYIWIGRDMGGCLYLSGYETVECEFHCYNHLFKFIEYDRSYLIEDLLKEENK